MGPSFLIQGEELQFGTYFTESQEPSSWSPEPFNEGGGCVLEFGPCQTTLQYTKADEVICYPDVI